MRRMNAPSTNARWIRGGSDSMIVRINGGHTVTSWSSTLASTGWRNSRSKSSNQPAASSARTPASWRATSRIGLPVEETHRRGRQHGAVVRPLPEDDGLDRLLVHERLPGPEPVESNSQSKL